MIGAVADIPAGSTLQADACVVGAGPAGIALALALSGRGLQVLVLEAGRHPLDPQAQALYDGELANPLHSPPHRYRMRGLGGSSTRWGGRCMPLDAIDFEARPWVPDSGWPLTLDQLLPHYVAANALAEAGRYAYDAREALAGLPPMIAGFSSEVVRSTGLERFSCPTDFGRRYGARLRAAADLRVIQGAVCTAIRLAPSGRWVQALEVAGLDGRRLQVRARAVALAAGGIETARLMLCSRDVQAQGVGNAQDVVGRYYMCHIAGNVGTLVLEGPPAQVRHGYELTPEGVYCRRRLCIAASQQRRLGLLNAVARLHFPRITDPRHGSGVLSGLFLARRFIRYEYARRLHDGAPVSAGVLAAHLMNLVRDGAATTTFLGHWLLRRTLAARKFPSVILANRANRFSLEVQGEQVPHRDSRISLAVERDALGMPRARIDWRHTEQDIASLARTLDLMAAEFARTGVGRLDLQRETLHQDLLRYGAYGGHHIGTTRMGLDPRTSVVDANCQVHGVANLFVAGSAVFPTSSQANPTLTLLALALRLGQHLGERLTHKSKQPLEHAG